MIYTDSKKIETIVNRVFLLDYESVMNSLHVSDRNVFARISSRNKKCFLVAVSLKSCVILERCHRSYVVTQKQRNIELAVIFRRYIMDWSP